MARYQLTIIIIITYLLIYLLAHLLTYVLQVHPYEKQGRTI